MEGWFGTSKPTPNDLVERITKESIEREANLNKKLEEAVSNALRDSEAKEELLRERDAALRAAEQARREKEEAQKLYEDCSAALSAKQVECDEHILTINENRKSISHLKTENARLRFTRDAALESKKDILDSISDALEHSSRKDSSKISMFSEKEMHDPDI